MSKSKSPKAVAGRLSPPHFGPANTTNKAMNMVKLIPWLSQHGINPATPPEPVEEAAAASHFG